MPSARKAAERLNQGVLITGKSGSGKSRMTNRLASMFRRVLYFDPMESFEVEQRARTHKEFTSQLSSVWEAKDFALACTFTNDEEYSKSFASLYALAQHTRGNIPNVCVVVDEVDLWSGPDKGDIDPSLSRLLRYGRHFGVSWIANCRADVHTNRDIRMNAAETLVFRQSMLSNELRKEVASAEADRGIEFPRVGKLVNHGPEEPPDAVENTHFIALPDTFDEWLPTWKKLADSRQA
jgi:hypothetical protein